MPSYLVSDDRVIGLPRRKHVGEMRGSPSMVSVAGYAGEDRWFETESGGEVTSHPSPTEDIVVHGIEDLTSRCSELGVLKDMGARE